MPRNLERTHMGDVTREKRPKRGANCSAVQEEILEKSVSPEESRFLPTTVWVGSEDVEQQTVQRLKGNLEDMEKEKNDHKENIDSLSD